jgi:predicted chitinase
LAEKERLKQLSWWDETATKVGLPAHGKVFHFHPVGLVGCFSTGNPLEITFVQLKQIFPRATDHDIDVVLNEINGRLVEFKLDTRLRQRHFFAQIKGEVGDSMKGVSESWEYSPAALKSFSAYYRAHPTEAEEDGYLKDSQGRIIRRSNQREIGRKHFQRLNGNRASHPDDGYNFRGRGLIQITGYEKYYGYMRDYNRYWAGFAPDTVIDPDLINLMPNAIRSAVWFWLNKRPYSNDSGKGLADVPGVTYIVNGGYTGLTERETAYEEIERILK